MLFHVPVLMRDARRLEPGTQRQTFGVLIAHGLERGQVQIPVSSPRTKNAYYLL